MIDAPVNSVNLDSVEEVLREKLAHGDAMTDTVVPVLRHLLANDGNSIFSDEVVASVRGMLTDIARQLLDKLTELSGDNERHDHDQDETAALTDAFIESSAFVGHVHALALESQLAHRLHAKLAMDPVLPPLIIRSGSLVASSWMVSEAIVGAWPNTRV
jgi:hypothetical protein